MGSRVFERLARDLMAEFPHMRGFSQTHLYNRRSFAAVWDGSKTIVQTPSGQLSWSHNVAPPNNVDDHELRTWYAARSIQHCWSVAHRSNALHAGAQFPSRQPRVFVLPCGATQMERMALIR
ncbi:DUF1016 N-terminal domain-containing protein [Arthrobacter burdickii]|uniref:DUF1016 N-terminal domain-containing protein n=1 Tax=Arthrobacter burdickii TaxID=3035920 RepID=A0ABT8JXI9_9MICC|nr:DUF1016 N-terminal domain-containing protein [Arthrobacter burdickii]MDN4609891.1 DUF1016 N-terminal domain-containing protein [Arthrobacter burdickii]